MNENDYSYIGNDSSINKNKKSVSIPTLIITIITTIVLVVVVVSNWSNILEMLGFEVENNEITLDNEFSVGQEVILSGVISDYGDMINYTHLLTLSDGVELGLKSKTINLNNYSNKVNIEGIIEKIQQGVPVIEVDTIYNIEEGDLDSEKEYDDKQDEQETMAKFLPNLGFYLDEVFFEKYSLLNQGEGGSLKIKNIDTKEIVVVDYFLCNESKDNENCDKFNDMFSNSSAQKFVDSAGITYYKQTEVQSWFFSNGSLLGYFVNDVEDSKFKELVKYITVIGENFVEDIVLKHVDEICWDNGQGIKDVDTYKLSLENNQMIVDVIGDDGVEDVYNCKISLDFDQDHNAKLISLQEDKDKIVVLEDGESNITGNNQIQDYEEPKENYDWTGDVEQFPINLEKSLEFTSRRGHTLVFPSSNIAYAGKSIQEDFDQDGVSCFSVMNVVQYSEKDLVDQKGNVKIYECNIKGNFDDSSQNMIYKELGNQQFVIEIVDPSWLQFGNNITIR